MASPLLLIAICTFIANDLDDIDKDRINHPNRPLPSGDVSTVLAAVMYFVFLASALLTVRAYVHPDTAAFEYYCLLVASISYGYVVDWFPGLKAPYVAGAITLPILIVVNAYPAEQKLYLFAVCVFLLNLGRELCKDIVDRPGDKPSFMHFIKPVRIAVVAFLSQAIGILLLTSQATRLGGLIALALMSATLFVGGWSWFRLRRHGTAIALMKLNLLFGMYFLT
jgi:geranylgeranylglycerol-phosphate geranylgeranyltransferase